MSLYSQSRITHLWYLFFWIILLSFTVVIYHSITESYIFGFSGESLRLINTTYIVIRGLILIAIIANIISLIFREIKYSFATEHLLVRKLLPTIRFTILFLVWIGGGFFILESLQVNTTGLLTGAGISGAIFALASKDILANLLGSLSIIMSKTFEIGETIRIKGVEGIVEEISLNYTKIMSIEGKVVYIPNRILMMEQLENLTRRRFYTYIFRIPFKKAIGSPTDVHDILMLIEGKIGEYSPMSIDITSEIPNANDFVYIFTVKIPEESEEFDREIREFLIPYIFPEEK